MASVTVSAETMAQLEKSAPEIIFVRDHRVACNGGDSASGHPKVYYTICDEGYAECGYCDRAFIYDPSKAG